MSPNGWMITTTVLTNRERGREREREGGGRGKEKEGKEKGGREGKESGCV